MNSVDRILNFINSQPDNNISTIEPKVEQEDITPKTIDNNDEPSIEQQPPNPVPTDIELTDKQYKNTLRKLNKINKKNNFPAVININGQNLLYNSADELNTYITNLKADRRKRNKELLKKNIEINDNLNKPYEDDDNDIEDDGIIYKKGIIKAVVKDNKKYKVPSTNKRDRQKIYNNIKNNKELLTELTKAKDDNEFYNISLQKMDKETMDIAKPHIENNINKDSTWNKASFMLMMSNLVNKYDEKHKLSPEVKKQIELQPFNNTFERPNVVKHGLNPALLQFHM